MPAANHSKPRKTIDLRNIRKIWWSGVNITTPMEKFKLRAPGVAPIKHDQSKGVPPGDPQADAASENCSELFKTMKEFWEKKHSGESEKPQLHATMNVMKVGELLGGEVLYQPKRGGHPDAGEQDMLRLSVALDLVTRQAIKNKLRFSGKMHKTGRKGAGARVFKERHVDVDAGLFTFSDTKGKQEIRKQIDIDAMKTVSLESVTIVCDYEEVVLVNSTRQNARELDQLVPILERCWYGEFAPIPPHARALTSLTRESHSFAPPMGRYSSSARGGRS